MSSWSWLLPAYSGKPNQREELLLRLAPFDDGNSRVGRLIMFKECLRNDVMPFILDDKRRSKYIDGIKTWNEHQNPLLEAMLST